MQIAVAGDDIAGLTLALRLRIKGHAVVVHSHSSRTSLDEQFTVIAPMRDLFLKSGGALDDAIGLTAVNDALEVQGLALPASGAQTPAIRAVWGPEAARAWGLLLQQAAETWQAVRTDRYVPRGSLRRAARRMLPDNRLQTLLMATTPDVEALSDAAIVFPYLRQTFGCWRFDGGMSAFESVLRERCLKLGIEVAADPAPANAMSLNQHFQGMFSAPQRWFQRGSTVATAHLGLPFVGMAAEVIADRIGRA